MLILDEVITGFGRLGAAFAAERFGVEPDMITMAKGLTNATVPMAAVGVEQAAIHDTLMAGPAGVELFHGYTYSGHPLACAAGLATLEVYAEEGSVRARADAGARVGGRAARAQGKAQRDRHPQYRADGGGGDGAAPRVRPGARGFDVYLANASTAG